MQSYHGFKIWAWSKNAPIELIFNMSDRLAKTIVHVKYEHNRSRPKIKNHDNFAIQKNDVPKRLFSDDFGLQSCKKWVFLSTSVGTIMT